MGALSPVLTPHGRLLLAESDDAPALPPELSQRLQEAFERGSGHGLLQLGAGEVGTVLPPVFGYWRDLGARYVTAVCTLPDVDAGRALAPIPPLPTQALDSLTSSVPPMTGAEYVTWSVLEALWDAIDAAFRLELSESKASVQDFLKRKSPAWNLVGRVHFNLAENRKDDAAPFAFLATYTTRLSAHAKAQHVPLGRALSEYAGAANRPRLLSLLLPVQRAAEQCAWLKAMVDAGEIYHPLRWTPAEAFQLLTDLPRLEAAGVVVRVPGTLAREPSAASSGERHRRRQAAVGTRHRGAPRFPDGGHARRRAADRGRDLDSCSPDPTASTSFADAGSRSIERSSRACSTSFDRLRRRPRPPA